MGELCAAISDLEKAIKKDYLLLVYTVLFACVFLAGVALEHYFPEWFIRFW